MIDRQEILEFAREVGLDPNVVEKDYVLGWVLAAIAQHAEASEQWVFKGGTCLKKCYFETYRFSEDLDFSLLPDAVYDAEALTEILREIIEIAHELSGITFPPDLYGNLEDMAQQKKVSLAWVVRDAAERYVADARASENHGRVDKRSRS